MTYMNLKHWPVLTRLLGTLAYLASVRCTRGGLEEIDRIIVETDFGIFSRNAEASRHGLM